MHIDEIGRDLKHALRVIARMPLLAAVVIISLGVGIGVNTTVFSWIQLFVFDPLPGVRGGGSFMLVEAKAETGTYPGASWLEYRDLRERLPAFEDLLAFRMLPVNVGERSRTERTYAQFVSANYFSALGIEPALGRFLRPEEALRAGGDTVLVISHDYWQTRLGGRADVLQRTLRVNDRELTIVGVTPEGFQGTVLGLQFDIWMPATLAPAIVAGSRELDDRNLRGYSLMGRLSAGSTRAQAQTQLDAAMQDLASAHPASNRTTTGEILPFWQQPRGPQRMFLQALLVLQAILLLLLLAVCGNTANLLLARASARTREIGVRLAIGAGPSRIVRLLVVENLLLALTGAALGGLIAAWGTEALRSVPLTMALPVRFQTNVDGVGLTFAALLGIGCALVFGAAPSFQLSRIDPHLALRSGERAASRNRLRNVLMGAEVALAIMVLIVAGLFLQSFRDTRAIDPGFRREGVLLAAYDLSGRNADDRSAREFARRLVEKAAALPGVESVSIAASVPLDIHGMPLRSFVLEGRASDPSTPDRTLSNVVSPAYFRTLGIRVVRGTDFAEFSDTASPAQVVVNEAFAERFLNGLEPLGRRLENRGRTYVIAGVVANSMYESFGEPPTPMLYFSYRDRPAGMGELHLLTRPGTETLLAPELRRIVRELDSSLPLYNVRTMNDHVETNLFLRRIPARMFVVLGPLLLILAAIGIYGVVAYAVAQRTREIGVRLALGATPRRVVKQIVREGLRVVGIGAALGWIAVYIVNVHINSGDPFDSGAFIAVPALLVAVAAVACWIPARRAARVDPMVALRHD
jgi:predicted permease